MIAPDYSQPLPETITSAHFVGIGGSGMSGIAGLFLDAGIAVSGSDRSANYATEQLAQRGARIAIGHAADNLGQAQVLVYTGALWPDNPEYLAAKAAGIPTLHRSQALAWLVRGKPLVAVAGAHGKTTTTGMIVAALVELGADPGFVNGGVIQSLGTSARYGADDVWVIEADESDGSFLQYETSIALITNVDADHLDHYGSHDAFDEAFVTFAQSAEDFVVISADDPGAVRVRERISGPSVLTFGEHPDADVRVTDIVAGARVQATLHFRGAAYPIDLGVPGAHNALNAAGAFAALIGMDLDEGDAAGALSAFAGTQRRFEHHATVRGVRVYDDYAHHPTEVRAALSQARSVVGEGRVIAVHQPHLYSRTQMMAGDFAEVYEELADHTVVLDVYGAREDPVPGVTGALVADRFSDPARVDFLADWQAAADRVAEVAREGDLVMTLSCGDVYRIIPQLIGSLDSTDEAPPSA